MSHGRRGDASTTKGRLTAASSSPQCPVGYLFTYIEVIL